MYVLVSALSGACELTDSEANILLTPFRTQNVPPPMSSHQLSVRLSPEQAASSGYDVKNAVHVSFSEEQDTLSALWEDGHVQLWQLNTRIGPGPGKAINPTQVWEGRVSESTEVQWRQVSLHGPSEGRWYLMALGSTPTSDKDVLARVHLDQGNVLKSESLPLLSRNCRMVDNTHPPLYQTPAGRVRNRKVSIRYLSFIRADTHHLVDNEEEEVGSFPEFCLQVQTSRNAEDPAKSLLVGLGKSGRLYAFTPGRDTRILATNANSFTISSSFVVFTTTAHDSKYVPASDLIAILAESESEVKEIPDKWTVRKVERGSRIVVAVPSTMSLVLQMPRGNLETINPRPLVMEVVTNDLKECADIILHAVL